MSKNNSINFWRFVFTIAIVVFHFSTSYPELDAAFGSNCGWRLAVEFFFVVSGFLLAYKCENSDMTAWEYTKHRFVRLFPCYFLMLIITAVLRLIEGEYNFEDGFVYVFNLFDEILMIHGTGVGYVNVNGAMWYISALVICGYIIYYLMKKYKDSFVTFIAPLSCIVTYSVIYKEYHAICGNIAEFSVNFGIGFSLLRGYAGMCAGVISYRLYKSIKQVEFTKLGLAAARIGEFAGFGIMLWYTFFYGSTKLDFIFVMFFVVCTALAFSREKKNILLNNRFVDYLGKISYGIYVSHIFTLRLFELNNPPETYGEKMFLLFLAIAVVSGAWCELIASAAAEFLSKQSKKIGGFFIKRPDEKKAG